MTDDEVESRKAVYLAMFSCTKRDEDCTCMIHRMMRAGAHGEDFTMTAAEADVIGPLLRAHVEDTLARMPHVSTDAGGDGGTTH